MEQDRLGSIVCRKAGETESPRIMITAHMDEIGFIAKLITEEGFIKFSPLGGWWGHVMLAQRVVITLEAGVAGDVPDVKKEEAQEKLGKGPVIVLRDGTMMPNLRLRDLFVDLAEKLRIPYRFDMLERGGTDSGAIHLHRRGVPNLVLSIPTRHIHSHAGIVHRDDYDRALTAG